MFVKYNAVLRGLRSSSHFLKNMMVMLCCPKSVADSYMGDAKPWQPGSGLITLEQAKRSLNKYTTTIHGIDSAIVKLSKLTKVEKVYRGSEADPLEHTAPAPHIQYRWRTGCMPHGLLIA
eukprot:131495-Prymnesium_polylepis.2